MKQLVQLQKHAAEFKKLNAELIFVFREESSGVDGLKKIDAKHKTTSTLCFDPSKSSKVYSPQRMTFDNYVIGSDGLIAGIVDGTLRDRATAEQLLKILQEIK